MYKYPLIVPFSEIASLELLSNLTLQEWKELIEANEGYAPISYLFQVLNTKIAQEDLRSNQFLYNEKSYWFDKATRVGLMNLANCSNSTMNLVVGEEILTLSTDKIKNFLLELELYAAKCYVNTNKHFNAIKSLKTVEDIINYDYTSGYPEKITLTHE